MDTLTVKKVNEVYMEIDCDGGSCFELQDYFTFTVPGMQYMPAVRNKFWDGKIRLFNPQTRRIYSGLLHHVKRFCTERDYPLEIDPAYNDEEFSIAEAKQFASTLDLPFEVRDYQLDAFAHAVKKKRALMLSPTASGKSLIIYLLARYYNKKTVIIVPTTSLVEQMTKDFKDYGYDKEICKIYSGQPVFDSDITITTWQSFSKAPKNVLESFEVVVGDEAHLFKANVLKGILEKMRKTAVRIGTTGTLDGSECHRLQLEGLFGPVKKVISSYQLMDEGTIANIDIQCVILRHTKQKKLTYQEEMDYLVSSKERNAFITNLVASLKGNTLVLFQYVEKHGEVLYPMLEGRVEDLHYVYGGTDTEDREKVRGVVEKSDNSVILASYGTFSTGVNIKRIDNIVFASPSKSRIRNLQSIGRGLRKVEGKESMRLFDIADDLQCDNYTLGHLKDRINIYNEEKFPYEILQFDLHDNT